MLSSADGRSVATPRIDDVVRDESVWNEILVHPDEAVVPDLYSVVPSEYSAAIVHVIGVEPFIALKFQVYTSPRSQLRSRRR